MSNPWRNNSYMDRELEAWGYPEHLLRFLDEGTRNKMKGSINEGYARDLRRQAPPGMVVNEAGLRRDYYNALEVLSLKASRDDLEPYEGFIPGGQYYVDENGAPASAPYMGSPMHLDTPYRAPSRPVTGANFPISPRDGNGNRISPRGGNGPGQETSSPQLPAHQAGPAITAQPPSDDQDSSFLRHRSPPPILSSSPEQKSSPTSQMPPLFQKPPFPNPKTPSNPSSESGTSSNPYNIEDDDSPSKGPAAKAAATAESRAAKKACRQYWKENGVVPGPDTGLFLDYTPIGRRFHASIDMSQYPPRTMTKTEFIRKWPKDGTDGVQFQEKPDFFAGRCTGDGNCWFRAVATHIFGDQELWNYVKAQHIEFLGHVLLTPTHPRHRFYNYLNQLNNGNRWEVRQAADRCTTGYSLTQNLWQKLHVPDSWWGPNEIALITADLYDVFLVISGTRNDDGVSPFFEVYGDPQAPNKLIRLTNGNHFVPYLQVRRGGLDWKLDFPSPLLKRYGRVVNLKTKSMDWSGIVTQRITPRRAPRVPAIETMGYVDWAEYDPEALEEADSLMDDAQKFSAMRTYGYVGKGGKGISKDVNALPLCIARGIAVHPNAHPEEELIRNDAVAMSQNLIGNTTPEHQKARSPVGPPKPPPCIPPQPKNPWPYQNGQFDR